MPKFTYNSDLPCFRANV